MKKLNKRGFTIVELSIVIAVVAILSAVLVPTFTGIVKKSQKSARAQLATNTYHAALGVCESGTYDNEDANVVDAYIEIVDGDKTYYFAVENGKIDDETTDVPTLTNYDIVDLQESIDGVTFYKSK